MRLLRKFLFGVLSMAMLLCVAAGFSIRAEAASSFKTSNDAINVIKAMEGFKAKPYWDVNSWKVGYGTNCPADKKDYYNTHGITEAEAVALLQGELASKEKSVNQFADKYGLSLKQHQFDALVSFTYNCGAGWMNETTGYFNTAVRSGDMGNALIYGMCLFSKSDGSYVTGLINRRMNEANMYINGDYKSGTGYPNSYRWVFLEGGVGTVRYQICGFDASKAEGIDVSFSSIPTGVDGKGNTFTYELAGWYTSSGRQVEFLDSSLSRGETLYARWKDPSGNILQDSVATFPRTGTVTGVSTSVNIRTGPGVDNSLNGTRAKGAKVTILEERTGGSYTVGGRTYNTWGKISDNEWIAIAYVTYDPIVVTYTVKFLNWDDTVLSEAQYAYGDAVTQPPNPTKPADNTYTYTFSGWDKPVQNCTGDAVYKAAFSPKYIDYTVEFRNADGTLISTATYHYGDTVQIPETPAKPDSVEEDATFRGWGQEITTCKGNAVYTAIFSSSELEGDFDGNYLVNDQDAMYLLRYTLFPNRFPVSADADVDSSGGINDQDAMYLLRYTLFPTRFPLYPGA